MQKENKSSKEHLEFLNQLLSSGKRFLLSFHQNPDPDSIGSNLALAEFLKNNKKQVTVVWGITGKVKDMEYLIDGFKVLESKIMGLDPDDYDALVLLDSASFVRIGLEEESERGKWKKIFAIDHHSGNSMGNKVRMLIEPNASSTCEILARLFFGFDHAAITPKIARMLKIGIWSDTHGFKRRSNPEAMALFSRLDSINPSNELIERFEKRLVREDMPILEHIMRNVQFIEQEGLTYALSLMPELTDRKMTTHLAADFLSQFRGIDVACILLYEETAPDGKRNYRLSVRSYTTPAKGLALKIAKAVKGTGHEDAAGATVTAKSDQSAKNQILTAIKSLE